jgi:hypothetical protein
MKQYSATIYSHWTRKDKALTEGIKELVNEGMLKQTYPVEKDHIKDLEMYTGPKALLQVEHLETEQGSKYKQINLFMNKNTKNSAKLEGLVLGRRN